MMGGSQGPEHTPLPPTGNQTSELQLMMAEPMTLPYPLNLHQNPLKTSSYFTDEQMEAQSHHLTVPQAHVISGLHLSRSTWSGTITFANDSVSVGDHTVEESSTSLTSARNHRVQVPSWMDPFLSNGTRDPSRCLREDILWTGGGILASDRRGCGGREE